ncbi:MAG: Y-family DNA polymerase [Alphaproteobacteria bacterium]
MDAHKNTNSFTPVSELKWLFFDLNSYFASVEQQERPELRGKPVAVVPMMSDSTCAIAASYEAKAVGIKTGTKIYEAKQKCPDLRCVLARHDVYVDYHHRIFNELENHLHVSKTCSVDEAACLLLGREREPDNARNLALQIKEGMRKNVGEFIRSSIGIAPNAYLAKMGTEMQKPDGLVILEPNNYQERLFALKLTDLTGINVRMEYRLQQAGIHSIEQFWNLSPKHARSVWGSVEGECLWYKLHGYDVPDKETQKSVIGHSRVLDPVLRSPDKAYGIARQLTVKAASRLRRYNLYAGRLSLQVRSTDKRRWVKELSFSPTHDNFIFIKFLDEMWRCMLFDLKGCKLLKVAICLSGLSKQEQITLDLFEAQRPKALRNIALTKSMDDIKRRFGSDAISVGACPKTIAGYVGTKIAFTRIPEKEEFHE